MTASPPPQLLITTPLPTRSEFQAGHIIFYTCKAILHDGRNHQHGLTCNVLSPAKVTMTATSLLTVPPPPPHTCTHNKWKTPPEQSALTSEEVGQINESSIVIITGPLADVEGVAGLQLSGVGVPVHHDHFGQVSVQAVQILGHTQSHTGGCKLCSHQNSPCISRGKTCMVWQSCCLQKPFVFFFLFVRFVLLLWEHVS